MKQFLKQILADLHISVTRNQKYDARTKKILARLLKHDSNCLDIGCHKGEILDLIIGHAPAGRHVGFEPIPAMYQELVTKYRSNPMITIRQVALYDQPGETTFQHVLNAPAYSGIKKRQYDSRQVTIDQITVQTARLDDEIPADLPVRLIKIDVEGAEYRVLRGAVKTLKRWKPYVIFEFGLGAADFYGTGPLDLFSFIEDECGLKISTLLGFLKHKPNLGSEQFRKLFESGAEYYFIAHP